MAAALFYGQKDIRLEHVPKPEAGPGEIVVRVHGCGICGSDYRLFSRGPASQTIASWRLPRILGHEFAGEVVEIGKGAQGFRTGDRVSAAPATWCGDCFYCQRGETTLCLDPIDFGSTHMGAMAEYALIPALMVRQGGLVQLPDEAPFDRGCLLEPFGTCVRGLMTKGKLQAGEGIVIIGDGPIALLQVMLAHHLQAGWIAAVGHHDERLALARQFGAHHTVNSNKDDPAPLIQDLSEGKGADLVIHSVPNAQTMQEYLGLVRGGGRFVIFGGVPSGSSISADPNFIHYSEVEITGSYNCTVQEFQTARDLSGHIPLEKIITHRVGLAQIREGFDLIRRREGLKILAVMASVQEN
jgi:threonine dehydrogenase-like Zn-dependent dehydrogenase